MSKRDAAVYREAAKWLHDNIRPMHYGACEAIWAVSTKGLELDYLFERMFKPYGAHRLTFWGDKWGDNAQECRILALLFAAAMSETSDL